LLLSLGIKYLLYPLQTDLGVGISRFEARILPSGGGKCGPVASMSGGWPDDHRCQISTVSADTLDRSYDRSLDSRASVISNVVLTYKDFDGAWHGQHDSSLVHVVYIFCQNDWIL